MQRNRVDFVKSSQCTPGTGEIDGATSINGIFVKDLTFAYVQETGTFVKVLSNLSLHLKSGSINTIIGPSGCGKSTLLMCLMGLLKPSSGQVQINGQSPELFCRKHVVGYVTQRPVFFEWLTVLQNAALPAVIAGNSNGEQEARNLLGKMRLADFTDRFPHELSGGMLARVALARALVNRPQFLFLDEAFSHLDEILREEINSFLQEIWLEFPMTIVAVTHSISEAVFLSDHVYLLSSKPATIAGDHSVPISRPRTPGLYTQPAFINEISMLRQMLRNKNDKD